MKKFYIFICLLSFVALPVQAKQPAQITIDNAYAYATTSVQKHGAVFLTLKSDQDRADKLVKASAEVSERVELHTHVMDGGMMMMREVEEGYDIPAHETLTLEPTGHHIMLMDLNAPLNVGETFPLTLEFENHWPIEITVYIKNPGDVD